MYVRAQSQNCSCLNRRGVRPIDHVNEASANLRELGRLASHLKLRSARVKASGRLRRQANMLWSHLVSDMFHRPAVLDPHS